MKLLSTLLSSGTEYFSVSEKKHAVNAGVITEIADFPTDFYALLLVELTEDKKANVALDDMSIIEKKARVEKFFDCNYSRFSSNADVTHCGKLGDREVINCPVRDTCIHEGKLCRLPNHVSKREAMVARCVARNMMDAEICHFLQIRQGTLRNHKNNIETKIGSSSKIAIAVWANEIGLVYKNE